MSSLSKSWKRLATSFVLVAIFSLGYIEQAKAFTLIEVQLFPSAYLVATQSALIKVTNFSQNSVGAIITVFKDNGTVIVQKTEMIAADSTFTQKIDASNTAPLSFHATVALDTANATVADVLTLDKTTGWVIATLPSVKFETDSIKSLLLPAVQLVASQSALIKVTNVSQNSLEATITVFRNNGTVRVQKTEAIARDSTFTLPVHASATAPLSFHATVELGTANAAVADVMTLDKTTGQIIAILPFIWFDTN